MQLPEALASSDGTSVDVSEKALGRSRFVAAQDHCCPPPVVLTTVAVTPNLASLIRVATSCRV